MGGYVGRALAKAGVCCVDVWVWHNGRFPFDGDCHSCGEERQPVRLHMDDGHEWRALGEFLDALTDGPAVYFPEAPDA